MKMAAKWQWRKAENIIRRKLKMKRRRRRNQGIMNIGAENNVAKSYRQNIGSVSANGAWHQSKTLSGGSW
jgi:hypothetical protein